MAHTTGRQLLDVLRRELIAGLQSAVSEIAGDLASLAPDQAFEGTAFAGKALAPVQTETPLLAAVSGLTSAGVGGTEARLRGWRDTPETGALGIAYVVSTGGTAVAALSLVPTTGPRLLLHAAGFEAGQSLDLLLANGFALRVSGKTAVDEIEIVFPTDQPPTVTKLGAGDRLEIGLNRAKQTLLGLEGGPSVRVESITAGGWVANTPTNPFERGGHLRFENGEVALAPGFLASLLPSDLTFPLDVDLEAKPETGVVLAGSPSLRTSLTRGQAGSSLDLAVDVADSADGAALTVAFTTSLDVSLPGAPVSAHVDGIGLRLPLSLRLGTPLLPDLNSIVGLEPQGAAVSVDLPVVSGSGGLARVDNDLAGALSVKIPPLSASAFGVLRPARDGEPLSFLVIMGATFPPPGIQVGFGFSVSGIGGVVGINRRIDRDALLRAVTDGTAAQLLFPSDPVRAGQAAIQALPAMFPPAPGSVVAGPMFQLSWGGRVVSLSVAVLMEASTQVRMTIIGKLVVALPDPEAPLVFLQATFAGIMDPEEPSVMFVASLTGSHIVGAPLAGDILLLTRGGNDPSFVLSAGGFHPSFPLPRGVPPLQRMSMDMCPVPWIDMRCENYFAVTSNTIQLGARLELVATVADCGLRGWLGFDALVQYEPFKFVADVSGGIALEVFGESLVGVALALHLEGPSPYLARGRGSIDLFLFELSFDFDVSWGSPAPALHGADVGAALREELAKPESWRARGSPPPGLILTGAAQKALADAVVVDPYGAVSVRQERVPLGIELQRFNGIPVDPQRWDLAGGELQERHAVATQNELRAQFAPGQFLAPKSDDDALTAPAFLPLKAGLELLPAPAAGADQRVAGLEWEERLIALDIPMPQPVVTGLFFDIGILETVITALSAADRGWWPQPEEVLTVEPVAPVTTAFAWSMGPAQTAFAANGLELEGALAGASDLMTVEAWEVAG